MSLEDCPNYPFCSIGAPADFPTPVVNGEPVAPILNTTPEQTAFYQKVSIVLLFVFFLSIFTHEINGIALLIQIVS